jgi:ABC-type nitrate/sulfonate/bicarbonate transport system substrate-binding protein
MQNFVTRLLMAMLAIVALASSTASAAAPAQRTPVRIEVPNTGNLQFFTLWVAVGAGLFQQEGLQPQIIPAATPRSVGERLFKGEADVALLPPPMFLGMMAEEKPVLLFASLLANEPINLILRKDIAEARKFSPRASLRERLQSVTGLKLGLAGEVSPRLRALFASAGMNADRDAQLVVVPGPDQVQAFAEGRIDALFAHTPYLETALVQYQAVLIADNSGGEVPELAGGQIHALATTREQARTRPQMIAAVTRAIARAQMLIHSDPKATVDAIIASGVAGTNRQQLEAITAIYAPAVPRTPEISLAGIVRDAALYPAHPRAPDFAKLKPADYVAAQFAQSTARP